MEIKLNGKPHEADEAASVQSLLDSLSIRAPRVAVMVNDAIVKKADRAERILRQGDVVEVISMVGGG